MESDSLLFEVTSVLDKNVRTTIQYWQRITKDKHPSMLGREADVKIALSDADEVRISRSDPNVYLYYKQFDSRFMCVVVRHENGTGFVITCYLTDNIKEGSEIWKKLK